MEVIRHIEVPAEEGTHTVNMPAGAMLLEGNHILHVDDSVFIPVLLNNSMRNTQYEITCIECHLDQDKPVWEGIRSPQSTHVVLGSVAMVRSVLYIVEVEGRLRRK